MDFPLKYLQAFIFQPRGEYLLAVNVNKVVTSTQRPVSQSRPFKCWYALQYPLQRHLQLSLRVQKEGALWIRWGGVDSAAEEKRELCIISAKLKCRLFKIWQNKNLSCNVELTHSQMTCFMYSVADPEFSFVACPQQSTLWSTSFVKSCQDATLDCEQQIWDDCVDCPVLN